VTRFERWLLRYLVRRQVARGFNDGRELTAMWRMVSEEAYKITPGHGTAVLLGQTLNRAQTERKAHELRRQLSEIEKTQMKNRAMNDDYEKGKADERAKIMKHLHDRVEHCFEQSKRLTIPLEAEMVWCTKGDEVTRMLNEIRDGKHDN